MLRVFTAAFVGADASQAAHADEAPAAPLGSWFVKKGEIVKVKVDAQLYKVGSLTTRSMSHTQTTFPLAGMHHPLLLSAAACTSRIKVLRVVSLMNEGRAL